MQRKEFSFIGQKVFIGIDVHKDAWRMAIAPEVGVVKGHSRKHSAKELLDFLKKHYPETNTMRFTNPVSAFLDLLCTVGSGYRLFHNPCCGCFHYAI